MISIAVCDDNELQRDILQDMLDQYREERGAELKTSAFSSGNDLIDAVRGGERFDIFLLDIIMNGMNGLETAVVLRSSGCDGHVIFLTASPEYAVASYEVNALYYMLKPIDRDKLFKILDLAVSKTEVISKSFTVKL